MNKNPLLQIISYAIVFLCLQMVAGAIVSVASRLLGFGTGTDFGSTELIVSLTLFNVAAAAIFLGLHWSNVSPSYIQSRPWSVLIWSAVAAIGTLLPSMRLQELMPELPESLRKISEDSEQSLIVLMQAKGGYAVVCLLAPLVEELVFRGAILRTLIASHSYKPYVAIAISALVFALAHINPEQMPHAFLIGLLLGWIYWRTGSILPGIVLHWTNNTLAFLFFRAYPDPDIRLIDVFTTNRAMMGAVFFSLMILVPALYQLHIFMKRADE